MYHGKGQRGSNNAVFFLDGNMKTIKLDKLEVVVQVKLSFLSLYWIHRSWFLEPLELFKLTIDDSALVHSGHDFRCPQVFGLEKPKPSYF